MKKAVNRLWIVVALAVLGVSVVAMKLAVMRPDRPPAPIVPATEEELRVLAMANNLAQVRSTDFKVPIAIEQTSPGTYVVTYWTPRRELALLGPRSVIVNLESNTVEILPRD